MAQEQLANHRRQRAARATPELKASVPNVVLIRRMVRLIANCDFERNNLLMLSRAKGSAIDYGLQTKPHKPLARWDTLRAEKRAALPVVCQVLLLHTDLSLDSDYLFEVQCSRRRMAIEANIALSYDPEECDPEVHPRGRIDYSRFNSYIRELQHAGMLHVATEPVGARERAGIAPGEAFRYQKLGRIFLTPAFFEAFGISREELVEALRAKRQHDIKRGNQGWTMKKRESFWTLNYIERNKARIKSKRLREILKNIKESFYQLDCNQRREAKETRRQIEGVLDARRPVTRNPNESLSTKYHNATVAITNTKGGAGLYLAHQHMKAIAPELEEGSEDYMLRFITEFEPPGSPPH